MKLALSASVLRRKLRAGREAGMLPSAACSKQAVGYFWKGERS